jgi:hypothetical protein
MVKRLVLGGSKRKRERVITAGSGVTNGLNWFRTRVDRGPMIFVTNRKRFRLRDQSGDRLHGQVVTRPSLSRDVWLPAAPRRSTNSPVRTSRHGCRTLAPDTGHRTRTPGTGHRTSDTRRADTRTRGRWTPTGRRSLDGRTLDMWTLTETRTGRPRDGGHPDILVPRRRWDPRTVLLWPAARGARQP